MWHTTNGTLYPSKTPGSGCNYYTTTYRFLFKTGHVGDRGPDGELASLISCRTDPNFTKTFSGNFTSAVFNRLSFHTALIKLKRPIVSSDESGSITFCSGCNHSSPSWHAVSVSVSHSDVKTNWTRWPSRWWTSGPGWSCAWPRRGTKTATISKSLYTTRAERWTSRPQTETRASTGCCRDSPWRPDSTGCITNPKHTYTAPSKQVSENSNSWLDHNLLHDDRNLISCACRGRCHFLTSHFHALCIRIFRTIIKTLCKFELEDRKVHHTQNL